MFISDLQTTQYFRLRKDTDIDILLVLGVKLSHPGGNLEAIILELKLRFKAPVFRPRLPARIQTSDLRWWPTGLFLPFWESARRKIRILALPQVPIYLYPPQFMRVPAAKSATVAQYPVTNNMGPPLKMNQASSIHSSLCLLGVRPDSSARRRLGLTGALSNAGPSSFASSIVLQPLIDGAVEALQNLRPSIPALVAPVDADANTLIHTSAFSVIAPYFVEVFTWDVSQTDRPDLYAFDPPFLSHGNMGVPREHHCLVSNGAFHDLEPTGEFEIPVIWMSFICMEGMRPAFGLGL
ncbi:hypothetical protein B0H17DRAFT_1133784 [Mycena rosella]|uniref:Uncharacterized protein n=1 Tax=Mycena rosella TaxID=1033263 RepID=A0AAD7GEQ4_MYCRO|nr:hypothetical protein B0H17DRAFT_1133784 [Mycena rosella]